MQVWGNATLGMYTVQREGFGKKQAHWMVHEEKQNYLELGSAPHLNLST